MADLRAQLAEQAQRVRRQAAADAPRAGAFAELEDAPRVTFTTTGRRTGLARERWWLPFAPDGDVLYLLEELGSDAQWVRNVLADPHVVIEGRPATARIVSDEREVERARRLCRRRFARVGLVVADLVERGTVVAFDAEEAQLAGGITNAGQVVRSGGHVLRPSGPHTPSVHALLRAVRATGFDGVPEPIGIDADGRERLAFVEGDVPMSPYPAWCQTDDALASVARLLRAFHDATRSFDPRGHTWDGALADPCSSRGDRDVVVCHNDVELSNVVFRDGQAVALIDLELAAPGRAVYDLAHLARLCVPIEDEVDRRRMGWSEGADLADRLRVVADAYGLDADGREALLGALDDALDRIEAAARQHLAIGGPAAVAAAERTGGIEKHDRRRRWWEHHRAAFAAALRRSP